MNSTAVQNDGPQLPCGRLLGNWASPRIADDLSRPALAPRATRRINVGAKDNGFLKLTIVARFAPDSVRIVFAEFQVVGQLPSTQPQRGNCISLP